MPLPTDIAAPLPAVLADSQAMAAVTAGITGATPNATEQADVDRWMRRINRTLAFDQPARINYVKCRRYARGDSGFIVDANIIGTNIDILESFIYAKNPDVDATPAKAVEMPSQEAMLEAALMVAEEDPRVQEAVQQAQMVVAAQTIGLAPPPEPSVSPDGQVIPAATPEQAVETARQVAIQSIAAENYAKIKAEYQRRTRENKAFADTSELVIGHMWKQGRLKDRGRPWVRSALTTGPGILKSSWQQRTAPSPETVTAINDLEQQVQRIAELRKQIAENDGDASTHEEQEADLTRQLQALKAQTEPVVSRGNVIDLVTPENFVVAPGFRIADHMDAPWNAERIPMEWDEGCALFKFTEEQKAKITKYMARKPVVTLGRSANADADGDDEGFGEIGDARLSESFVRGDGDADYNAGGSGMMGDGTVANGTGCFMMVWEIWDRTSNSVLTAVEGLQSWAKPAWNPCATTRFYPYFLFCTSEVDGQRHPQSPVERSAKLVDEYNRIGSAEAKHRRRIIPKTAFNAGAMDDGEAQKLAAADVQEMVPLKLLNPQLDIRTVLLPITYAAIDVNLYDRTRINNEIERIWGVQEALGGSINTAKTATEADIQQQGFEARTGSRRDAIEATLSHMALYTLEVARCYLTDEDVRAIAGPNAYWPAYEGGEDLRRMVNVDIRAGSTGKPNTKADREAWGMALPHIQQGITTFAQLTGSNPLDVAESVKKLARITAEVAGVRIDIDSLFPAPGQPVVDPMTGKPVQPGMAPAAGGDDPQPGKPKPPGPPEPAAPNTGAAAPEPAGPPA